MQNMFKPAAAPNYELMLKHYLEKTVQDANPSLKAERIELLINLFKEFKRIGLFTTLDSDPKELSEADKSAHLKNSFADIFSKLPIEELRSIYESQKDYDPCMIKNNYDYTTFINKKSDSDAYAIKTGFSF